MKLIRYLLNEAGDWEPGDGKEKQNMSPQLYRKWEKEKGDEENKKLKETSPEFQRAWEQEKKNSGTDPKADKTSIMVAPLIRGRYRADMKAFNNAREKDPKGVAQSFGVPSGSGWEGIVSTINAIAGSDGIGSVITGGQMITNERNLGQGQRKMLGVLVNVSEVWASGHEKPEVSKKLVAWWVKQVLQGAFEAGLIKPPAKNSIPKTYRNSDFKTWDNDWKVYEGGGGLVIFYGPQKWWNGG